MCKLTPSQLKDLLRDKIKITSLLYKYNPEGNYQPGQTCFCPFHDNTNTPSASIYDNDGVETLYCFSEKRLYTSADVVDTLMRKDVYEVASRLWETLPDYEKQEWLSKNSNESYIDMFSDEEGTEDDIVDVKLNQAKKQFRKGTISFKQLIDQYIRSGGIK